MRHLVATHYQYIFILKLWESIIFRHVQMHYYLLPLIRKRTLQRVRDKLPKKYLPYILIVRMED
jgi:hypothetical protein